MNFNATSVKRGFGDLWMGLAIMQDFNRQDRERLKRHGASGSGRASI